jgi:hypothetical protein
LIGLARDIEGGELANPRATYTCLHGLLSSIIKIDKEFTNWFAANPTAEKESGGMTPNGKSRPLS